MTVDTAAVPENKETNPSIVLKKTKKTKLLLVIFLF